MTSKCRGPCLYLQGLFDSRMPWATCGCTLPISNRTVTLSILQPRRIHSPWFCLQGPFDAIFYNAVFGNLLDEHAGLTKACFLLRPGGHIVISHPLGRAWHEEYR